MLMSTRVGDIDYKLGTAASDFVKNVTQDCDIYSMVLWNKEE